MSLKINVDFEKEVYNKYQALVYSTCFRRLHIKSSIDDAVQSTFLLYIKDQDNIKSNLSAWFYWASVNVCIVMNREASKYEDQITLDENLIRDEQYKNDVCLDKLIHSLPKKKSELLLMRFYENLSFQEISEKTNTKEASVRKSIERIIFRLQKKFKKKDILVESLLALLYHASNTSSLKIKPNSLIIQNNLAQQSIIKGVQKMLFISKIKFSLFLCTTIFFFMTVYVLAMSDRHNENKTNQSTISNSSNEESLNDSPGNNINKSKSTEIKIKGKIFGTGENSYLIRTEAFQGIVWAAEKEKESKIKLADWLNKTVEITCIAIVREIKKGEDKYNPDKKEGGIFVKITNEEGEVVGISDHGVIIIESIKSINVVE